MTCPDCSATTTTVAVPASLREHAPADATAVSVCSRCLRVDPGADGADQRPGDGDDPDLSTVSDAFPRDAEAAAALVLLVGRLDSLATNRETIAALVDRLERAGVDPFLALDRLADDPALSPAVDLAGRRRQLEQLL